MNVVEIKTRDSSKENAVGGIGASLTQSQRATRRFRVQVDSVSDGPIAAETAPGIPRFGDTHPEDSFMTVRRVSGSATDSPLVHEVTVEYERIVPVVGGTILDEPPEERWFSVTTELESPFDVDGKLYATTAGELFDGSLRIPFTDVILQRSFNSETFDASLIFTHVNHVNSADLTTIGAPAGTALLRSLSSEMRTTTSYQGGLVPYYRVTYEIAFRNQVVKGVQKGWTLCVLNTGNLIKDNDNKLVPAWLDGMPSKTPLCISADGKSVIRTPTKDNVHVLEFKLYPSADFSVLGID